MTDLVQAVPGAINGKATAPWPKENGKTRAKQRGNEDRPGA